MSKIETPFGWLLVAHSVFTVEEMTKFESRPVTFASVSTANEYGVSSAAVMANVVTRTVNDSGILWYRTSVLTLWSHGFWGDAKELARLSWSYDLRDPLTRVNFMSVMRTEDVDEWGRDSEYL